MRPTNIHRTAAAFGAIRTPLLFVDSNLQWQTCGEFNEKRPQLPVVQLDIFGSMFSNGDEVNLHPEKYQRGEFWSKPRFCGRCI